MAFIKDAQLEQLGDRILAETRTKFPGLAKNQIALTWLVYKPPIPVNTGGALIAQEFWKYQVRCFSYRGVEPIYPGKMVQLFYLVAIHEWLEKGMVQPSSELDRAIRDMAVKSSNDATSLIVDVLTGTTSGPELSAGPLATWQAQRNIINRYFQSLGWPELESINVNQKTWGDGAYGRDRIFMGELMENRNLLTANATAWLLHCIVGGIAVSSRRSQAMMALLKRSLADPEMAGFLGSGLPAIAQIWSKGNRDYQLQCDAAYIEIPDRLPYLLVAFIESKTYSQNLEILPFISGKVVEAIDILS